MTLGETIKNLRQAKGLSEIELAIAIGKREYDIWRFEHNKNVPVAQTLKALAKALGTTTDRLLSSVVAKPAKRKPSKSRIHGGRTAGTR